MQLAYVVKSDVLYLLKIGKINVVPYVDCVKSRQNSQVSTRS